MLKIGVILPSVDVQRTEHLDLREAARYAEEAGLDSIWMGDHLATGAATLDMTIGLSTAAAVTERIAIGASVFVPAIRPLAWAAKQIASLQYVSGERLILGVGSGGGEEQWRAAEVPFAERGRRTDRALRALPDLLAGKPAEIGVDGQAVQLAPAVARPRFWVGNDSAVARRRAAQLGDGWFPSLVPVEDVATGREHLEELADRFARPVPTIAIGGVSAGGADDAAVRALAAVIAAGYGMPYERALSLPLTGTAEQVADQLGRYADAGASHAVLGVAGTDWRTQVDHLAAVRALL
ncbi:LLM class flavin-dependent oxidoreductase [Kribbella pittospori]|uniref:LLM class flavin-dependent oxidoreductase n=1 Tax=Kribbella pittospori TaxID=722689 RepID=A0A4R0L9F2_9ACTN|nr:LLM class flavin-dependent oxidoreductase [Kribbella pittospori]TCC65515.1 LLM class flavin-dependent oxidoreductase [Kribbella pittospori]